MNGKKRNKTVLIAVLILGLILMSGCIGGLFPKPGVRVPGGGSTGRTGSKPAGSAAMIADAEAALTSKQYREAATKFEAYLKAYPKGDQADYALAKLGELREQLGEPAKAMTNYETLLNRFPNSIYAKETAYRLGPLYMRYGKFDESIKTLNNLLKQTSKAAEQSRVRIMLARTHLAKGETGTAMDLLLRAANESPNDYDRMEAERGIQATLAAMTPDDLLKYQAQFGEDYPGGYITYVLAYRQYEAGRKEEALFQLDALNERFPGHRLASSARKSREIMTAGGSLPALTLGKEFWEGHEIKPLVGEGPTEGPLPEYRTMNVACILPLSGSKWSKYGDMVQKGLKLAFKTYNPTTKGFKSELLVLDSKGNPDTVAQLLEEAAAKPNLLAVVGPLLSTEAAKGAPKAQELKLPMLAITQKSGIPQTGDQIFRLFLTPKAQAEAVARYAVQVLGFHNLASLYPQDKYGTSMHEFFQGEVRRLGANVVSSLGYKPDTREFSKQIEELAGVGKALRRVGAGRKVKVNFEAVFIPDGPRAVTMIAPQFPYHDIMTVKYLGTSLWHKQQLLSSVAKYTQGSVIPTAFFADMDRPEVKEFVEAFRAAEGDSTAMPGQFEAYGYDAGRLLLYLMDKRHVSTREGIAGNLRNMSPFPGVTGRFYFGSDGEFRVEPVLITVKDDEFKPVGAEEEKK